MRQVLVLGGTGFVGRSVCERLFESANDVRLLVPTRRLAHGRSVRHLPTVDLIEADVHDDPQLARLVASVDAVVNLIAILHGNERQFRQVHVELPRRLMRACEGAGVRRIVHVSAIGVAPSAPSNYLRSKTEGEALLMGSGLDVTVLRPSVIFGADDKLTNLFATLQSFAPVIPLGGSAARFQPVWVEDVARALVHCLHDPRTIGRIFEACGPREMTLSELVRLSGRFAGHERPQIPLPGFATRLQALAMELLPGEPLMSRDNVDSMQVPNVASGALPGLDALGISPAAIEAVAPGYLAPDAGRARLERWRAWARRG